MNTETTPASMDTSARARLTSGTAALIYLAVISLSLHAWIHSEFGFHRDEFLYIALGEHLDWGFLEVPPLIAVVAFLSHAILGNSYFAYHFFPALAGALIVFITGLITREIGGNRFSQILAAVCVLVSPAYIRSSGFFMPVVFEQLYVTLFVYFIILLLKTQNPKWWLLIGVIAGIGLMNKYSMGVFIFGFLGGLIFTSNRKMLLTKWPWTAAAIALLIFFPNIIWQYSQDWPIADHMQRLKETQFVHVSPLSFISGQVFMNLISAPVWLAGIYFFIIARSGIPFRTLGWIYAIPLAILLAGSGKDYYLLPVYPMLLAGGACLIGNFSWLEKRIWLKFSMIIFIAGMNIPVIPYGIPVLSVKAAQEYCLFMAQHTGLDGPLRWETGQYHRLPQDYADMVGWEEIVQQVAKVYRALPREEQPRCAIFASEYAFAGAIDYYGEKYELPKAISFNASYYTWGPRGYTGELSLIVGAHKEDVEKYFDEVTLATIITNDYSRENNIPVCMARKPKTNFQELWPKMITHRY